jgi:bacteriophage CI repressor helix-turn-helix domain
MKISDRVRELRIAKNLTQQEFADKLKIKRSTISNYDIGRSEPSESAISLICREFNVSEEWLRTGEGEMFVPITRDEEIATFIGSIQADVDDTFKKKLISVLAKLDEKEWDLLEKMAEDIVNSKKETK